MTERKPGLNPMNDLRPNTETPATASHAGTQEALPVEQAQPEHHKLPAEEALRESEAKYKTLYTTLRDAYASVDMDGRIQDFNQEFQKLVGYTEEEIRQLTYRDLTPEKWHEFEKAIIREQVIPLGASDVYEKEYRRKDGSIIPVELRTFFVAGDTRRPAGMWAIIRDITERKRAENRERLARDVLNCLNCSDNVTETIRYILFLIKQRTGLEAVGIRLREGDDFPYYQTYGFPDRFVQMERGLCARDETGAILRDPPGNPLLECMCGNILCGRTNPALPFFTDDGSFWSNCTTVLLATMTEQDCPARTRNNCNSAGYESVALVPLRSNNDIIGLLQFNDHRKNQFTPDMIRFFEGVGTSIAIALSRSQAEKTLRASENRFRVLVENLPQKIFLKDRNSVYISCNKGYAQDVKIKPWEIAGKTDYEFFPKELAEKYRADDKKIIESGEAEEIEEQYVQDGKEVFVHTVKTPIRDEHGQVSGLLGIFWDITERKQTEKSLRESEQRFKAIFDNVQYGVLLANAETKEFLACNPKICQMLGYRLDELKNLGVGDIHPAEDLPYVIEEFGKQLRGEIEVATNLPLQRKDGSVFFADISSAPVMIETQSCLVGVFQDVTARVQAEKALRDSEERYRVLVNSLDEGVGLTTPDEVFQYANSAASRIFGVDDLIGKSLLDFIPQEIQRTLQDQVALRKAGKSSHYDLKIRREDGECRDILITASPRFDTAGHSIGTYGIFRDITELKAAESALRNSEAKFRTLYDSTTDAVMLLDQKGFFDCNKATLAIFGCATREEFCAKHPADLSPPEQPCGTDSMSLANERIATAMEKGSLRFEWVHMRADTGATFPAEVLLSVMQLDGIPVLQAVARDITERKLAEAVLKNERDLAQLYLDIAAVLMVALDTEGRITLINQYGRKLMGYHEHELIGESWFDRCVPDDRRETIREMFGNAMAESSDMPDYLENEICTCDGQRRMIAWHNRVLRDHGGRIIGTLSSGEDITERIRAEADRIVLEKQLRSSQKMEAIGTLAGGIAHDFNNILTPILAYTELIIESLPETNVIREDLVHVSDAALRAKDLVRQILTFSRQTEKECFSVSMVPILKETIKLLRASLPSSIDIRENINPDTGEVVADLTEIQQIVMNLCTNAAWAMHEKGGLLEITLDNVVIGESFPPIRAMLVPGAYVVLSVKDNGCGMDSATLARVFEPFFTTKGVGEGTGLGLPVVHGIVKSCGGDIVINSTLGRGSDVTIYLPRASEIRRALVDIKDDVPQGSECVLLVDDEPDIVEIFMRILERYGYRVTSCTSSVEALGLFKSQPHKFDVIITDQTMPRLSGNLLAHEIKVLNPNIPIIMMTGFSSKIAEDTMRSDGIDALLFKPVFGRDLARTIRTVIGQRRVPASSMV